MCLFVNTLRPEVTLRIWDMFLNEGNKVLFRISAALFKLHEKRLLAVKDASDLFTVLRVIGKDVIDPDILIATAYKDYSTKPIVTRRWEKNDQYHYQHSSSSSSSSSSSQPTTTVGRFASSIEKKLQSVISPRLDPKSSLGAVPNRIIGVGLAHLGSSLAVCQSETVSKPISNPLPPSPPPPPPSIDLEKDFQHHFAIKKTTNDGQVIEVDAESISPASPIRKQHILRTLSDEGILEATERISNELFEQERVQALLANENNVTSRDNDRGEVKEVLSTTAVDGGKETSENNHDMITTPETKGNDHQHDTNNIIDTQLEAMKIDSYAEDIKLMERISEIQRAGSFLEIRSKLSPHITKIKKSQQSNRKTKNGEFSFYRADITLWRNSFRPGLEERYVTMEQARALWRQKSIAAAEAGIGGQDDEDDEVVAVERKKEDDQGANNNQNSGISPPNNNNNHNNNNGRSPSLPTNESEDGQVSSTMTIAVDPPTEQQQQEEQVWQSFEEDNTIPQYSPKRQSQGLYPPVSSTSQDESILAQQIVLENTYSIDHEFVPVKEQLLVDNEIAIDD
jgi:hypothetical protein